MDSILFGRLPHYNQLIEKLWLRKVKNKSAQWPKLHTVFTTMTEELDNNKSAKVWAYTDSWAVVNDCHIFRPMGNGRLAQTYGSHHRNLRSLMDILIPIKRTLFWDQKVTEINRRIPWCALTCPWYQWTQGRYSHTEMGWLSIYSSCILWNTKCEQRLSCLSTRKRLQTAMGQIAQAKVLHTSGK